MSKSKTYIGDVFDNTYFKQLDGFYAPWQGDKVDAPALIKLNDKLAATLQLSLSHLSDDDIAAIMCGAVEPDGADALAQAYCGHQFGNLTPLLGDGRALLLGEVVDCQGQRVDIHLKGSGPTPFSRGGDGKSALGPVLREYLLAEAMHALGVPTTRALAATLTGEKVMRKRVLPGAVLARVAKSHIRVGTFQLFAMRGEPNQIKQLADYTIARHYPDVQSNENRYLALFNAVCDQQAKLIAKWMSIGFVHGVMNTDNMTISGETIDYGPCAFIDAFDENAVFSSIDHQGRYAYRNQPGIAQWNLARFAESLLSLVDQQEQTAVTLLSEALNHFKQQYQTYWLQEMRAKLGLEQTHETDENLITGYLTLLERQSVDFTRGFRFLADAQKGKLEKLTSMFANVDELNEWLTDWQERLTKENTTAESRFQTMNRVNPLYIPRNHLVEAAIESAEESLDFSKFEQLLSVVTRPFDEFEELESFTEAAPAEFGPYRTFCGT